MNPRLTYEICELAVALTSSFLMVCLFDSPVFSLKHFDVILQLLFTIKGRNFRVWLPCLQGLATEMHGVLGLDIEKRKNSNGFWNNRWELAGWHVAMGGGRPGRGWEGNTVPTGPRLGGVPLGRACKQEPENNCLFFETKWDREKQNSEWRFDWVFLSLGQY